MRDPNDPLAASIPDAPGRPAGEPAVQVPRDRREEQFRLLFEKVPLGIAISRDRRLLYTNPALLTTLGYGDGAAVPGENVLSFFAPEAREGVAAQIAACEVFGRETDTYETTCITADGRRLFHHIAVARIVLEDGPAMLAFHTDISARVTDEADLRREIAERQKAEGRLLEQQVDLRALATELGLAEERERRRVAAQLHDTVVQLLAFAKIRLGLLRSGEVGEEVSVPLDEMESLLQEAIERSRAVMYELSASALYEIGFEQAIQTLAEQSRQRLPLKVTVHDDGQPKPLEMDLQVVLFQAIRELLDNVGAHAAATAAEVDLARRDDLIAVTVSDDGRGLDASLSSHGDDTAGGLGLFSIRQRLRHFGGTMEVFSETGQGTRVTLKAPLSSAEAPSESGDGQPGGLEIKP